MSSKKQLGLYKLDIFTGAFEKEMGNKEKYLFLTEKQQMLAIQGEGDKTINIWHNIHRRALPFLGL